MNIGYEAKRVFHNKTGLGNYSRNLITLLSKYLPKNNYFLYNPATNTDKLFQINNTNIFEINPKNFFYRKFTNLWRQIGISNRLKIDKIKIFHGLSGEIPFGLKSKNIKTIVTIHDLIFIKFPDLYSFWDKKIHFYKFKKAAQHADIVIAISEQTKTDIIEILNINPSKIRVIYQGCHSVFKENFSIDDKRKVIKKYNLPAKFILNVGTIETRKNILLVIQAIKNIDIVLVIVGQEKSYANEIKKYIADNCIQEKVIFLKNLSLQELAIVYQTAIFFVFPSFYEGFGIPIIEAMYSKIPVITTKDGVFPEAGGGNSIYVNPNSMEEMQNAIQLLLNNQNLRNEIAIKGNEFVQKFNDKNIANQYLEIYEELIC